jgi:hypothetical protein
VLFACLTFATVAACGDDDGGGDKPMKDDDDKNDDGGGNTEVDTGLDETDTLASLNDDEAQQACVRTAQAANTALSDTRLKEIACSLFAITSIVQKNAGKMTASDVSMCEKVTQDCVDGKVIEGQQVPSTVVTEESMCDGVTAEGSFGDCEATVADFESCMSRRVTEIRKRLNAITCDALKDVAAFDEFLETSVDLSNAPECKGLATKCPDIDLSGADDESDEG